ncbi:class I SAM-dependent methyltransferase [Sphingomonas lycopersici]|uniref:Methyltransferase n=1 Tax=Sphingomonas lycopersici TaxID=2951807 RepID=A0AA41ZCY2_9SPHN|nr:methyltransferase [Sphingomonas lycopersici]MCW6537404.1 methyltransferase [Sphingomonas lycopersici]
MRFAVVSTAAAALLLAAPSLAQHEGHKMAAHPMAEHALHAALADPARPAKDKERDATRHPAELLSFMGVKPGDKVGDFIMGSGYWTRILAKTVGEKGKVYAYQPAEFIAFRAAYGTDQDDAAKPYANVVPSRESLGAVTFPEKLDAIITVQNWHDLHLAKSPATLGASVARALYDSLKPGGVLLVVDHVGAPGATPFAVAETLHRGDADATKKEIEAAGFKLAGTSPIYANPADPHTNKVFDPAIRGKTDQFVYKFVKS